jgi:large subunit ribosomal protein L21
MKYAVVKIGGSQYQVAEGDEIEVEKLDGKKGERLNFNEILLFVDDGKVKIGRPLLKNLVVKAEVLQQLKGRKIRVATYKAKSRYRRVVGHRKLLTRIKVRKIVVASK